jgi:hypothetical protein
MIPFSGERMARSIENSRELQLAADIIDLVEDAIRAANKDVDAIAEGNEGNTLLYGERYYKLEDEIADLLVAFKME